jgi:hypothetical protein
MVSYVPSAARVGSFIFAALAVFQLLLAVGLPLGAAAWGGQNRVLPRRQRLASVSAAVILVFAAYVLLAKAEIVVSTFPPRVLHIATWVFTAYLALNVFANLRSKSRPERQIMGPVSLVAFLSCLIVARYG